MKRKFFNNFAGLCGLACVVVQFASANELPPLDCVIEPFEVVEVSSAAEGVIERLHVERNDLIERGQVIAELESDVEKASLAFARLNASLDTDIKLRRASMQFDERNKHRVGELYVKKAIPLHHKDEAETDAVKSQWLLMKAEDDKRLAQLEHARARAVVARKTVRSPIDGIVLARHKSAGEYIEDQAIVTVAQLHPLRVEVIAPVELFGQIEAGMTAQVFPELASAGTHAATVISVDRVIDGASGTFDVRLELPNSDYNIPSGLKCQLEFSPARLAATATEVEAMHTLPLAVESANVAPTHGADNELHRQCNAIGPFTDEAETERAKLTLSGHEFEFSTAQQYETVVDRYLIVAPANDTVGEVADQIAKHGIASTSVITDGDFAGQILFGEFDDKRVAERRRLELKEMGFAVSLKPELAQQPRFWLEVGTLDPAVTGVRLLQMATADAIRPEITVAPCGYPDAAGNLALE